MRSVRVLPMPEPVLAGWRVARADGGAPLPGAGEGERQEAVTIELDGVHVGGALLGFADDVDGHRCWVRVLQTTIPHTDEESWVAVGAALEAHVRRAGVAILVLAVAPALATAFGRAGFQATMISASSAMPSTDSAPFNPDRGTTYDEDRRISVRPMTPDERRRFVAEAGDLLREGMRRAGVVDPASARLDDMDARLASLLDDPPPAEELVVSAVMDGRPVGAAWATVRPGTDGPDFVGNAIHLFPEYRGRGLSGSFLGALSRYAHELQVRDVHVRVYAHDDWARHNFLPTAAPADDVHVRKDLR